MAVFRVERIKDYTVMSNHHLRNKNLSLKAKGLLSQMLSLPDDWDYTLKGLAAINKESVDAIRTAIWELEDAGYVVRTRVRDERGCLCVEMESFALFANAQVLGKNAACLLTISDSFVSPEITTAEQRQTSFTNMMKVALGAEY